MIKINGKTFDIEGIRKVIYNGKVYYARGTGAFFMENQGDTSISFKLNFVETGTSNLCIAWTTPKTWTKVSTSGATYTINAHDRIYFKASKFASSKAQHFSNFTAGARIRLGGDLMSLQGNRGTITDNVSTFEYLFYQDSNIHINTTSSADNFFVSLATLPSRFFEGMFKESGLETIDPNFFIEVSTIGKYTCYEMFRDCTSLINFPYISVDTVLEYGCEDMFYNCSKFQDGITARHLPATNLSMSSYCNMFKGCSSLWFVEEDALPATVLANYAYESMFENCSSLLIAPNMLNIKSLGLGSCMRMFSGCSKLAKFPTITFSIDAGKSLPSGAFCYCFAGCSELTTIDKNLFVQFTERWNSNCCSSMFANCTNIIEPLKIYGKIFESVACKEMFRGCSKIIMAAASSGAYTEEYQLPVGLTGSTCESNSFNDMFTDTGGTWAGTPNFNTRYYYDVGKATPLYLENIGTTDMKISVTTYVIATDFKYKINNGAWNSIASGIVVSPGSKISFKANSFYYDYDYTSDGGRYNSFIVTGSDGKYDSCTFAIGGNLSSLINYNIKSFPHIGSFAHLLGHNTGLTTIKNDFIIPWTDLSNGGQHCFAYMFADTSITSIPQNLLASITQFAENSCEAMFARCTSINTTVKFNPETKLAKKCFFRMYRESSVSSFVNIPKTPRKDYCFAEMFCRTNIDSLSSELFRDTDLAPYCYSHMFDKCKIVSLPEGLLPCTNIKAGCYWQMFANCSKLMSIPENLLPATVLAEHCYSGMFYNSAVASVCNLPATTLANHCYGAQHGTTNQTGYSLEYSNNYITIFSAVGLKGSFGMFDTCPNLTTIPNNLLPATELADYCYNQMFKNCYNLTNSCALPAATLKPRCYGSMFSGCAKLSNIPEDIIYHITDTKIPDGAMLAMFLNCKQLQVIKLPQTITEVGEDGMARMFQSSGLNVLPKLSVTIVNAYGLHSLFADCDSICFSEEAIIGLYDKPYTFNFTSVGLYGLTDILARTGGTFTDIPVSGQTYYTLNDIV